MSRTAALLITLSTLLCMPCHADSAMTYRFGTFGFGLGFDHALNQSVTLRLGYNYYRYGKRQSSSGVDYDASAKVQAASMLIDWYPNVSNWRITTGVSESGVQLSADGTASGTVTLNGQTYNADQLGFIHASFKPREQVSPYLGVGYGRSVGSRDQFNFLFDLGALYIGSPKGHVDADCGVAATAPECTQLIADIEAELADYEHRYRRVKWWPVVSAGFAMRW